MKRKKLVICVVLGVIALAIALVFIFGGKGDRLVFEGGGERTAPIEKALGAIFDGDGEAYYEAFPPALRETYDALYVVQGGFPGCADMSDYLKKCVHGINGQNYGEDYCLFVKVLSEKEISVEALESLPGDVNLDNYTYQRFVTESNTDAVFSVEIRLCYEGELDSEEKEIELYVIKQDGEWYLHPFFAFYGF